jgi:hypothetical protein
VFGDRGPQLEQTTVLNMFSFLSNDDLFRIVPVSRTWTQFALHSDLWQTGDDDDDDAEGEGGGDEGADDDNNNKHARLMVVNGDDEGDERGGRDEAQLLLLLRSTPSR